MNDCIADIVSCCWGKCGGNEALNTDAADTEAGAGAGAGAGAAAGA